MKRRSAIRNISAIAAGIALFPGCSDGLKLSYEDGRELTFDDNQQVWIEAISEAILPKKDLTLTTFESFPEFVTKMISFSKSSEDQTRFVNGYNKCTEDIKTIYKTAADQVTPEQIVSYFEDQLKEDVIAAEKLDEDIIIDNTEKKMFCKNLRELAIKHLTTSKEYQEQIKEYKLVPGSGTFNACVEV